MVEGQAKRAINIITEQIEALDLIITASKKSFIPSQRSGDYHMAKDIFERWKLRTSNLLYKSINQKEAIKLKNKPSLSLRRGKLVGMDAYRGFLLSLKLELETHPGCLFSEFIPKGLDKIKPEGSLKKEVFIVHGHSDEAKLEVVRFIEKIGLKSIILNEQVNKSKTIIEKIEKNSDVGFGVVIYTPCDVGAKHNESNKLQGRARQNVIFEHGFLMGKLGRENVCLLIKGDVEIPNDISGIVYTPMDSQNWEIELAKELKAAGYTIDMNKVF